MGFSDPGDKTRRFETQVMVHLDDLYRAAVRLTAQPSDAEDLVQETCLRAFRALDQLRNAASAKPWVFSILRSVFVRRMTEMPRRRMLMSLDDAEHPVVTAAELVHDAYEQLRPLSHALLQEAREAILKLPLPYREAIVLVHIGGFSYRESAKILGVRTGTVMSRLFRARRLLRNTLGERSTRRESA